MKTTNETLAVFGAAFLFLGLFGFVGGMDYQDEVAEERYYAEMVCAGHWPDYKGITPDCKSLEK